MRFVAEREPLLAALSFVTKYVNERVNIPILADILVEASSDSVTVTGTDLERVARGTFAASVEGEGRICLPGHLLLKAVKSGSGAEVSVDADDAWAVVRIGKSRLKLPVLPTADFPGGALLTADAQHNFSLPGELLADVRRRVIFAREPDGTDRHYLTGSSWLFDRDGIEFCATDGKRMAVLRADVKVPGAPNVIVPDFDIPAWNGDVSVELSEKLIRLTSGRQVVASKLIEATYPDYRGMKLIPENPDRLLFDRKELLAAAGRASLVADARTHSILVVGRGGSAMLSAVTAHGEISDEIAYEGPDFQTAIQHSVLSTTLASFDSEMIELRWRDHATGITAHDPKDDSGLVSMQPYRDPRISEFIQPHKQAAE